MTLPIGRRRFVYVNVHALVAEAFIGSRPAGYCVNHKDGNRSNNCVDNLEWVTQRDNQIHKIEVLRSGIGPNAKSKLTADGVRLIRAAHKSGIRGALASVCRELGISAPTASDVTAGRTWRHVDAA